MALLSGAAQAQVTTTETLNFNDNLMPAGWSFTNIGSVGHNLQINNQRFEIGRFNTYGGLVKPIDTSGVRQIRIEFDSNIAPVFWGQGSSAGLASNLADWLHDGAIVGFSMDHATNGPLTFQSTFRPATGSTSNELYLNRVTPIDYGDYHMNVLFEDGQVSQTVTNLVTGTSFSSGLVAAPGLLLANMHGMLLNGYTFDGTTWIDNASISITTAVPEPDSYALLLAGLGMLGAVGRRKQQQVPVYSA